MGMMSHRIENTIKKMEIKMNPHRNSEKIELLN